MLSEADTYRVKLTHVLLQQYTKCGYTTVSVLQLRLCMLPCQQVLCVEHRSVSCLMASGVTELSCTYSVTTEEQESERC